MYKVKTTRPQIILMSENGVQPQLEHWPVNLYKMLKRMILAFTY